MNENLPLCVRPASSIHRLTRSTIRPTELGCLPTCIYRHSAQGLNALRSRFRRTSNAIDRSRGERDDFGRPIRCDERVGTHQHLTRVCTAECVRISRSGIVEIQPIRRRNDSRWNYLPKRFQLAHQTVSDIRARMIVRQCDQQTFESHLGALLRMKAGARRVASGNLSGELKVRLSVAQPQTRSGQAITLHKFLEPFAVPYARNYSQRTSSGIPRA